MKSDTGRLTKETLSTLILTTTCMIELCRYCIGELNMSYFLPGKIQTDELEHRFSLYLRMAGTHYHISLRQVFEVENKLCARSVLNLTMLSKSKGIIVIGDFSNSFDLIDTSHEITVKYIHNFKHIDVTDADLESMVDKLPLVAYLAGYCCHSVMNRLKCDDCGGNLVIEKPLIIPPSFKHIHNCD
ncbi:hypothetical protein X975_22480, partial [Stegodyphus mimosarum]